jgi:hypothetical protein
MVLVPLMPDARLVTRERLIRAWYECERLSIDLEDTNPEAFAERWAARIAAHLARGMLEWLWREGCFAPLVSGPRHALHRPERSRGRCDAPAHRGGGGRLPVANERGVARVPVVGGRIPWHRRRMLRQGLVQKDR